MYVPRPAGVDFRDAGAKRRGWENQELRTAQPEETGVGKLQAQTFQLIPIQPFPSTNNLPISKKPSEFQKNYFPLTP
jgi:hypothetical protein